MLKNRTPDRSTVISAIILSTKILTQQKNRILKKTVQERNNMSLHIENLILYNVHPLRCNPVKAQQRRIQYVI
jgi:hypothetical protein